METGLRSCVLAVVVVLAGVGLLAGASAAPPSRHLYLR